MATQVVSARPKELLLSRDCLLLSNFQGRTLDQFIAWAEIRRDHIIVEHPIGCPQCYQCLKERSGISSDEEMDGRLITARNRIKQAREGRKSIA